MDQEPSVTENNMGRREFLKKFAESVIIGSSALEILEFASPGVMAYVHKSLKEGWESLSGDAMKRRNEFFISITGKSINDFSIDVGDKHPRYIAKPDPVYKSLHPDNLKLANSFEQLLTGKNEVEFVDKLMRVNYEKSVWAIGGAMSTLSSYLAENYQGKGYNLKWTGKSKLRWHIIYDTEELKNLEESKDTSRDTSVSTRNVERGGKYELHVGPNWALFDMEKKDYTLPPTTGMVRQQPLLVSRLPNKIGSTRKSREEVVFITEAPHGDGTRGFGLLLDNFELLSEKNERIKEWYNEIKQYEYFQSLFKVTLSYDSYIPKPFQIDYVDTEPLTRKDIA